MSVKTSTFGAVKLSGPEAEKFRNQILYGRPTQAAKDSYARGKEAAKEYAEKGFATFTPKPRSK
jgi:hypothetical protein